MPRSVPPIQIRPQRAIGEHSPGLPDRRHCVGEWQNRQRLAFHLFLAHAVQSQSRSRLGIADALNSNSWPDCNWKLLSKDGKFVGRFVDGGSFPHSVLGGAGAFLGARGEHYSSPIPGRAVASAAEDPPQRRSIPRGGAYKLQYEPIPLLYPQHDDIGNAVRNTQTAVSPE